MRFIKKILVLMMLSLPLVPYAFSEPDPPLPPPSATPTATATPEGYKTPTPTPTIAPAPTASPRATPADQSNLAEWWGWCQRQKHLLRISDKWVVPTGGGSHEKIDRERLKVPGPPVLTPFGSMSRQRNYTKFVVNGVLRGLLNQGWSYQTHSETGIGVGQWNKQTWREE